MLTVMRRHKNFVFDNTGSITAIPSIMFKNETFSRNLPSGSQLESQAALGLGTDFK